MRLLIVSAGPAACQLFFWAKTVLPEFRSNENLQENLGMPNDFDIVQFCIDFEEGNLDVDQIVEGFQHMIDDGTVWRLQGMYGRYATALISQGRCQVKEKND
jgi:hypothetical protein